MSEKFRRVAAMFSTPHWHIAAAGSDSRRQRGVTLIELMIALVLAALVVLAATAMVVTSRTSYRTQDETTRLAESARFALDLVNRMVRLTGYTNFGDDNSLPAYYVVDPNWRPPMPALPDSYAQNGPNLSGTANSNPPSAGTVVNQSDSLTLRYFGANQKGDKDFGAILDCAGYPVPQPTGAAASGLGAYTLGRAYNVLFVEADADGEPALKCLRQTYSDLGVPNPTLDKQTLIRGVATFRVLYGELGYGLGAAADPDLNPAIKVNYRTGIGGSNSVVDWKNVVSVKVALLLRSAPGARADPDLSRYDLFGPADASAGADPTTHFTPAAADRTRQFRLVQTTIFVRNRLATWPAFPVQ